MSTVLAHRWHTLASCGPDFLPCRGNVAPVAINRWWLGEPDQRFWMEASQRTDAGVDLHAPQLGKEGKPYWGYALVMEVEDGDVVFHYSTVRKQIESWSVATGGKWEDETVWAARGSASRGLTPHRQPGFFRGLHGPFALGEPLSLDELREEVDTLSDAYATVEAAHSGNLYKPFHVRSDGVRAGQGYLFKLPAELVAAFPKLGTAAAQALAVRPAAEPPTKPPMPDELGRSYRPADEDAAISERDPFPTDPAVVERGVRGHARTQNALAVHIATQGFAPLSPAKDDPLYDLLWRDGATLCVAEVKSLTTKNEERQLRLGLGQVLRYRQRLHASSPDVRAHLVTECQPTDPAWQGLCDELDVVLAWPEVLQERL